MFSVQGSGFRVQGLGFKVQVSGCGVHDARFMLQGIELSEGVRVGLVRRAVIIAHKRQSRQDYSIGFDANVLDFFSVVPPSLGRGRLTWARAHSPRGQLPIADHSKHYRSGFVITPLSSPRFVFLE